MVSLEGHHASVEFEAFPEEDILCRTDRALGDGVIENICDIIHVPVEGMNHATARTIAAEIAKFDRRLREEKRPYLLIGPGRWGSSDPSLGIPVEWQDICGARVIVETPMQHRVVEPSQGTHFFQNVVAMRVGYLTVGASEASFLDDAWLRARTPIHEVQGVRWLRFDTPMSVLLNGRKQCAMVVRDSTRRAAGRSPSRT